MSKKTLDSGHTAECRRGSCSYERRTLISLPSISAAALTTPINPTANYVGLSGNFAAGAGYNINKKNTIFAEFQWNGLPPNTILHLPNAPFGNVNLYSITTNYKHSVNFGHSPFGGYVVAGGGWYYRFASIDRTYHRAAWNTLPADLFLVGIWMRYRLHRHRNDRLER